MRNIRKSEDDAVSLMEYDNIDSDEEHMEEFKLVWPHDEDNFFNTFG